MDSNRYVRFTALLPFYDDIDSEATHRRRHRIQKSCKITDLGHESGSEMTQKADCFYEFGYSASSSRSYTTIKKLICNSCIAWQNPLKVNVGESKDDFSVSSVEVDGELYEESDRPRTLSRTRKLS